MLLLVGNWWAFVLRGTFAILFGLLCFIMPHMALLTLIFMFGFYALADGVFSIVAAFRRTGPKQIPWWALLLSGIISIIAGGFGTGDEQSSGPVWVRVPSMERPTRAIRLLPRMSL